MVSIIIPTYNRLNSLLKAIESILAQKNDNYEIIVVDDGSTDGTPDVLKGKFDNISIGYTEKRAGPSHARNVGISISKGEYLWFLDSDVILPDENMINKMIHAFNSKPKIGSLGGEIVVYEKLMDRAYGRRITWNAKNKRVEAYKDGDLKECDYLATCNCFIKKKFAIELNGFDEQFVFGAEDMDFGFRLNQLGLKNYTGFNTAVHHFHEKAGRYENETTHYQKTRIQYAKKHYDKVRLFAMLFSDFFICIKFYILLPLKLLSMILSRKKIERQNIMGGWYILKYYFC